MKKKKVALIIFGIVVVAVCGVVIYNMNFSKPPAVNQTMVEAVNKDTIIETVSAKGEVSLLNTELIYATTMAEVGEVLVEKNDMVKKGDVLIRYTEKSKEAIENRIRDAELNLRSAQISLNGAMLPASDTTVENARISVRQSEQDIKSLEITIASQQQDIVRANEKIADAEKAYNDHKSLYELGAVSKEALDTAEKAVKDTKDALKVLEDALTKNKLTMESANESHSYRQKVYEETLAKNTTPDARNLIAQRQISLEQSQIILNDLKKELDEYQPEIVSPIDGVVSMLSVSKGELTSTERALMEISNVDDYVIKVDVNERNAAKIALNQEVEITGAVLGKSSVSGKITKIGSIAELKQTSNGTERVVPVEITVVPSEESKVLKPGFSLDAKITTKVKEDIVVVPILATLRDKDANTYVFVVKEDNTLEKRIVELGLYADMFVEATNISEGEKIVSQPTLDMTEGMLITPQETVEAGAEGSVGQ